MITVIKPHFYWPETTRFDGVLEHIERCGRICYKSEDKITENSAMEFCRRIRKSGHESVFEHASLTAIIVCSRACSHQLVRHRIAAYSQESQRFCDYGKVDNLQVVCPPKIGLEQGDYWSSFEVVLYRNAEPAYNLTGQQQSWLNLINGCYREYLSEINEGVLAEDARFVLPNATKTELAVTFNLRQWRHVFRERALNTHAQWEIREIFTKILVDLREKLPAIFDDLAQ